MSNFTILRPARIALFWSGWALPAIIATLLPILRKPKIDENMSWIVVILQAVFKEVLTPSFRNARRA